MNKLYGWVMSQTLSISSFKWVENTSLFNEGFIKNYSEDSDAGYLFVVDAQYPEELHELHNDLPFIPEKMKIENVENLVASLYDKKNKLFT